MKPPTAPPRCAAAVVGDLDGHWWSNTGSRLTGYKSGTFTWHFTVREDDGWRVERVTAPVWCGGYVAAATCR